MNDRWKWRGQRLWALLQEYPFLVALVSALCAVFGACGTQVVTQALGDGAVVVVSWFTFLVLLFLWVVLVVALFVAHNTAIKLLPTSIEFFDVSGEPARRKEMFRKATDWIRRAEHSIYVLNGPIIAKGGDGSESDPEAGRGGTLADRTAAEEARREYYDALIAQAGRPDLKYVRIVQLEEAMHVSDAERAAQILHQTVTAAEYRKHFAAMLNAGHRGVTLKVTRPTFDVTFVLIDGKYVVWQIDEITESGNARMSAIFLIHDPSERIARPLARVFDDADVGLRIDAKHWRCVTATAAPDGPAAAQPPAGSSSP